MFLAQRYKPPRHAADAFQSLFRLSTRALHEPPSLQAAEMRHRCLSTCAESGMSDWISVYLTL